MAKRIADQLDTCVRSTSRSTTSIAAVPMELPALDYSTPALAKDLRIPFSVQNE